jgi:hypothetical protein
MAVPDAVWRRFPAVGRMEAADNGALVDMWMRSFRYGSGFRRLQYVL